MTKIGVVVLVFCIFTIVSLTYTHFYNKSLDFDAEYERSTSQTIGESTTSTVDGSTTTTVTTRDYTAIGFFFDMFAFSVPDMPFFFSVIWWILLVPLGWVIVELIRGV